uniref:AP-5 complex subunit beta-1 n=1 Tax=Callorhinchus milii TaxID=7868 RepID=A0A4W3GJC6_CALMI|eukprot:gi/632960020/ref/XP_007895957.1/ PREDICTED: AP-5 complex subunit beta-1 isoform X2 [Callorhinchus milii]
MATLQSEWTQTLAAFYANPTQFLTSTTTEIFVSELVKALADEKFSENVKVQALGIVQEFPSLLFTGPHSAFRATLALMDIFRRLPFSLKCVSLKCHLLLSLTTVVITAEPPIVDGAIPRDLMARLIDLASDSNDRKRGGAFRPLRAAACDCLRELETCRPGLLASKLELLSSLQRQEMTPLHQAYTVLYSRALKNALRVRCRAGCAVPDGGIRQLLHRNEELEWEASGEEQDLPALPIGTRFFLNLSPADTKDLKSTVSLLLEESYLLTPVSQAALLQELAQIVLLVRSLSPAIFKSQLLRLFGTMDASLVHTMLHLKATFTDSLFTVEDESFLLKRLVGMAQHPLLSTPLKLFHTHCILHFPENRPIGWNADESLPVLLTPNMAAFLFPTLFNDSNTMLSRLSLVSLAYLESTDEERGPAEVFDYLVSLYKLVNTNGNRERLVTFFRAVYIFFSYFHANTQYMSELSSHLVRLYQGHCTVAPHLINLINSTQELQEESKWPVALAEALQKVIVELPMQHLAPQNLTWHLQVLARVTQESSISQGRTVECLLGLAQGSDLCQTGDWRVGNSVLSVCRSILQHQNLETIFSELADLLQHLFLHFQDVDIQDHAHFYYTMLTSLSGEKLSGIVARGVGNGTRTKARSLSSIMPENTDLSSLSVLSVKHPTLQLVPIVDEHRPNAELSGNVSKQDAEEQYLEKYLDQFNQPGFASTVVMKYYLTFAPNVDSQYHKVFSVLLRFDLRSSHYEPIPDLHVPCLFFDRKPHTFSLALKPNCPYPTVLHTTAIFTTEDGHTCCSQLEPVQIGFSSLFLHLPIPAHWPANAKANLFDHLWESLAGEESSQAALSLFCFKTNQSPLSELVELHFHTHLVSKHTDPERYKILLFLPPRYHVLYSVGLTGEMAKVDILTDNWKLLPLINAYLLTITSEN